MEKYTQATDLEHMRNQTSMYLGGKAVISSKEYIAVDAGIQLSAVQLSPAAVKLPDEILVNAIDQYTMKGGHIWVEWQNGTITITNTGSHISIYDTQTRDGRAINSMQMIFGEFRTSSHFDTTTDSITGGMFGTGSKGVNAFSQEFIVETYDPTSDQNCWIRWSNCMSCVDPVELTKNPTDKLPFTRVVFLPNYVDFNMQQQHMETYKQLLYMRVLHTAVFCNSQVYWNGEQVKITARELVARHTGKPDMLQFKMSHNTAAHDLSWTVVLAVRDAQDMEQVSLVNGIYVKRGTHLDVLVDQIVAYVKPLWMEIKDPACKASKSIKTHADLEQLHAERARIKIERAACKISKDAALLKQLTAQDKQLAAQEKLLQQPATHKFDKRCILKYLFVFMYGYVNRPSFTGQRKDEIDSPQSQFQCYVIPQARLQELWELLKPWVEFDLFSKSVETRKPRIVKSAHHKPAGLYAGKRRHETTLFIPEGDSAEGTIDKGISSKSSALSHQTHGLFTIGGVPMNARKEISYKTHPKTGQSITVMSERLKGNERLNELEAVLGLDHKCTYSTYEEREKLHYGCVVIATDQDEDGKGNIRSQLLNWFWTFWPHLVKHRYVKFLITPIVRAFHKRGVHKVQEFYTEQLYRDWASTADTVDWDVVYYKGLGSHGEAEINNMFSKYEELLITYTSDVKTETVCEVFFGLNADLRKLVLVTPNPHSEEHYYKREADGTRSVSATDHLNTETRSYQIYNISRHIRHAIDGGLPSRRKIWAGARAKLSHNNQRLKVYQLGGHVSQDMNYHHGDASLSQAITGETQCFPGAREFPMLLPLSNSGSRKKGGTDAGSARYIYTKLNKALSDAMFPPIDDYTLEYTFDDGHRGEPTYYVPVTCLSILENYSSPGHAWTCVTWARDYWAVSSRLRIDIEKFVECAGPEFPFTTHRYKHRLQTIKGVENSVGCYHITNNTLVITELPVRVWGEHFLNGNPNDKKSKGIADEDWVLETPIDSSTDTDIHIEIKCRDGFLNGLNDDDIVKKLDLKQSLKSQINMIGLKGAVVEFSSYRQVYNTWYAVRREHYLRRISRMTVLLRLRLVMYKQQLLYIAQREQLNISGQLKLVQNQILHDAGFKTINKQLLDRPTYTDVQQLELLVMSGNHDYLRRMDADDLSSEGEQALQTRVKDTQLELDELLQPHAVERIWTKELDKLDAVVKQGQTQGWLSWEVKPKW